jgi:hypothetical protein
MNKNESSVQPAFILHPSAFILAFSESDSGLTRNTRAPGYRCSVPGLAEFTGATLCGARSLIRSILDC